MRNHLRRLSDTELQERHRELDEQVNGDYETYRAEDLEYLEAITIELYRRGYRTRELKELIWYKENNKEEDSI